MNDVDREESTPLAFRLIHDIQAGLPGAAEELVALARRAAERGWGEVERACTFGEAVRGWISGDDGVSRHVARLIEQSRAADDSAMLALGLAMRSDQGLSGEDAISAAERDEDLACAVVLLETAKGRPCERISAHTAAAIALGNRWLFELSHDQYEIALAIGENEPPGSVDFLLAPILFNLAEEQVSWASKLRQLGDEAGVLERWQGFSSHVEVALATYPMPEAWRTELDALGLLLAAIAGHDTIDRAETLLRKLATGDEGETRAVGLVQLAVAINLADSGLPGAEAATEKAVDALSPAVHPFPYDLALFQAATLEARASAGSGLRYARRALEEQWSKRHGSLAAMQARLQSERLASERELLSRNARLDDLTGIGNRRAFEQFLADLCQRQVRSCALILFDADTFKEINDTYGHLAGDAVLIRIARVLEQGIRPSDLAVRLGGDEFALVLPDANLATASKRAEGLLAALERVRLEDLGQGVELRVSAGVACGPPSQIIEVRTAADAALYKAKAAGGHCVRAGYTAAALEAG